jgi:hypothetical protein
VGERFSQSNAFYKAKSDRKNETVHVVQAQMSTIQQAIIEENISPQGYSNADETGINWAPQLQFPLPHERSPHQVTNQVDLRQC